MVDMNCEHCRGTGADAEKTRAARRSGECDFLSYIRCWHCVGNGLDPAKFFNWGQVAPAEQAVPTTQGEERCF